jgi:hypothetical protein
MRRLLRWLAVVALSTSLVSPGYVVAATQSDKSSDSSDGKKTVHVKGYTKKDGTHVKPHDRKAPEKHSTKDKDTTHSTTHSSTASTGETRDANGYIDRSEAAKREFMRQTGYPNGRPGFVVDHMRPLACGGADAPSNMQWQTVEAAKEKDRTERRGC